MFNTQQKNDLAQIVCNSCKKHFRLEYRYLAWQAGIKEKIIEMTLNSSGVRDTGRELKISKDTVCSVLKKNRQHKSLLSDMQRII
jgi:transposase-like protein